MASIDIMKSGGTAVYGSQAINGVVIIRTNRRLITHDQCYEYLQAMVKTLITIILIAVFTQAIYAQAKSSNSHVDSLHYLNIPTRSAYALAGSAFVARVSSMSIEDRETAVVREILSGNVPSFSRKLRSLKISHTVDSEYFDLIYFIACDYMAIGSEQDYLYIPLTPSTAQYLADSLNCLLPTKTIVDRIYTNSDHKLSPQPIPPSEKMTTIQVFAQHTDSIKQQILQLGIDRSANDIIAGHKKDIIISNKIATPGNNTERVVIYGWHLGANDPIQPVYSGHIASYVDYSHGVRLISKIAFINGNPIHLEDLLKDPVLSVLLSSEGVIRRPYYPESKIFTSEGNKL